MKFVPTDGKDVMFVVEYGSKLYGTNTPTSDTDYKVVYLPDLSDVLLGKKMVSTKVRFDAEGKKLTDDNQPMPANGVECEFVPFQTFVREFVRGQTYAVECAYALLTQGPSAPDAASVREHELLVEMVDRFSNSSVYSMVSFAQKQTFDYVRRGERKAEAELVLAAFDTVLSVFDKNQSASASKFEPRLDTPWNGKTVLDHVVSVTGLKVGQSVNNNKAQRTLELNGRSYLESTTVRHVRDQVQKTVGAYGDRTDAASKKGVDTKSLSHAVRVYQQSLELLATGKVSFPRPNAAELLAVKQGVTPLEEVKKLLVELDDQVLKAQAESTVRPRTPELEAEAEQWLLGALRELYDLPKSA